MEQEELKATRQKVLERLRRGAAEYACGGYLNRLSTIDRYELHLALSVERIQRKLKEIDLFREECQNNWHQVFYLLYFRTLGDRKNRDAYLTLARRVPYHILLRERSNPMAVEAMLLGTSGLLQLYASDNYISLLQLKYFHLQIKYSLQPMQPEEWDLVEVRPANHPILRIAQAAQFFTQDQFALAHALECHTEEDVRKLFCVEAPEYWHAHYTPDRIQESRPKRIGTFKANIIGINLVVTFQFAYSLYTNNEDLRNRAFEMLENLPAEDNRYIRDWYHAGAPKPANALESQSLLQLATEHCAARACDLCPVGRKILYQITHPDLP